MNTKWNFLWSTYRVSFITLNRSQENVRFFRGFEWEVVSLASAEAKRKSEAEGKDWTVYNITKI